MKTNKRFYHETINGYEIKVKDYGYKSRAPVAVLVSGTKLGECVNTFGEPCYYFRSEDAFSMEQGISLAKSIVNDLAK